MNALNHGLGMGVGWIVSVIVLVISIWFIVQAVKKQNNSK